MIIENRVIEENYNGWGTVFYLHGHQPLPKVFIDEVDGYVYRKFNVPKIFGKGTYLRIPLNDYGVGLS